jgi:flagellar motor switch/type III secretory pathway protein FliN
LIEVQNEIKLSERDELYTQYNWFYHSFFDSIKVAAQEFFSDLFDFKLVSISKNINILFQGDDYFVTKVRIDKYHDVFFRCSEESVKIILDEILGENKKFKITNITELEAKIISSFNDYLYGSISRFLLAPPPRTKKRKNFDAIHLTFFVKQKKSYESAKIILSLPQILLAPQTIHAEVEKFDKTYFNTSKLDVNIKVGKTKFYVKELKHLEKEDIVVFEDSDIHSMRLVYKDYEQDFNVAPNPGILTSIDNNNGGHNMEKNPLSQSLWDEIQVEMGAEFEKVKITLGELKNIEEGLVLDLSSVYENKITLKVENKVIATGELIIVNDRYGVKIDEVFASEPATPAPVQEAFASFADHHEESYEGEASTQEAPPAQEVTNAEEEFDYSDFELDDQDI